MARQRQVIGKVILAAHAPSFAGLSVGRLVLGKENKMENKIPSFVEHTTEHAECMQHLTHVCKFCGYSVRGALADKVYSKPVVDCPKCIDAVVDNTGLLVGGTWKKGVTPSTLTHWSVNHMGAVCGVIVEYGASK